MVSHGLRHGPLLRTSQHWFKLSRAVDDIVSCSLPPMHIHQPSNCSLWDCDRLNRNALEVKTVIQHIAVSSTTTFCCNAVQHPRVSFFGASNAFHMVVSFVLPVTCVHCGQGNCMRYGNLHHALSLACTHHASVHAHVRLVQPPMGLCDLAVYTGTSPAGGTVLFVTCVHLPSQ